MAKYVLINDRGEFLRGYGYPKIKLFNFCERLDDASIFESKAEVFEVYDNIDRPLRIGEILNPSNILFIDRHRAEG
jgi:hypothetical protein